MTITETMLKKVTKEFVRDFVGTIALLMIMVIVGVLCTRLNVSGEEYDFFSRIINLCGYGLIIISSMGIEQASTMIYTNYKETVHKICKEAEETTVTVE